MIYGDSAAADVVSGFEYYMYGAIKQHLSLAPCNFDGRWEGGFEAGVVGGIRGGDLEAGTRSKEGGGELRDYMQQGSEICECRSRSRPPSPLFV